MLTKLAVKRLTASDLTLFEWHFRNVKAGNQKAINLNADVFIDALYPSLPTLATSTGGRIPLDLYLYGPGLGRPELNLQRKIVKGDTYKNWRLNGEFIADPLEHSERFHVLAPGDLAVFEFTGEVRPEAARIVFLSMALAEDKPLIERIGPLVTRMAALSRAALEDAVRLSGASEDHPIQVLFASELLKEAAQSGEAVLERTATRRPSRPVTRDELRLAKQSAEITGEDGEALINEWLMGEKAAGRIKDFKWVSQTNAVSPFDFQVIALDGQEQHVDVKATSGKFERAFHLSAAELRHLNQSGIPYIIYRVFQLKEGEALLRICDPLQQLGVAILATLGSLPKGVESDGVVIEPSILAFAPEIAIHSVPDSASD